MSKLDDFMSIKNSSNVPGYNEDQIKDFLSQPEIYSVCDCPVCGHKYLGSSTICNMCGYDEYSDDIEKSRKIYNEKISKNPSYVWALE